MSDYFAHIYLVEVTIEFLVQTQEFCLSIVCSPELIHESRSDRTKAFESPRMHKANLNKHQKDIPIPR